MKIHDKLEWRLAHFTTQFFNGFQTLPNLSRCENGARSRARGVTVYPKRISKFVPGCGA